VSVLSESIPCNNWPSQVSNERLRGSHDVWPSHNSDMQYDTVYVVLYLGVSDNSTEYYVPLHVHHKCNTFM
jgi:hypothetical protein